MSGKKSHQMRSEMRRVLSGLDERWLPAASREASQHLAEFLRSGSATLQRVNSQNEKQYSHVLAFLPSMPGEVDLSSFIAEECQNRSIYLPRKNDHMGVDFIALHADWQANLTHDPQGFVIASTGDVFDMTCAEECVVLIPGLAFDYWGARLGRGDQRYSALLQGKLKNALKVGVCWSLQLVPELPDDSHLVLVDFICTENEVLRPKSTDR